MFLSLGCFGTGGAVDQGTELKETTALIARVTDGDTVAIGRPIKQVIRGRIKNITRVRYIGIDTPETDEPFYRAANSRGEQSVFPHVQRSCRV